MAKSKEKHNGKQDKTKKATIGARSGRAAAATTTSYTDGTPLDGVQYLEAKLILKPDRFDSVQSFRDFGKIVQRTAKKPIAGVVSATRIAPALRP